MERNQMYINGQWVDSSSTETRDVINPTTEEVLSQLTLGQKEDVDAAVQAAKDAFPEWNAKSPKERASYLQKIADGIRERKDEILQVIIDELGVSRTFAEYTQVERSADEIEASIQSLDRITFEEKIENTLVVKEGTGVVAAINPWNFPLNQIQRKISSALLAGNSVVVKPASETPGASYILADIVHESGLPAGVFNLVTGSGSGLGDYLAKHEYVSLISFTGSTEVGQGLYDAAKTSVKHLVLELGGKSALILLPKGDKEAAVHQSVDTIINNSGQTCTALTRLLVPKEDLEEVEQIAKDYVESRVIGDPNDKETHLGPLVSKDQQETVLTYIEKGKEEGAQILTGGAAIEGQGYFVQPTIFTQVTNDMTIAQEEIFGPVLCILTYETVDQAIEIANDTKYGLSGAVVGPEDQAVEVARKLRTGNVIINGASQSSLAPFGGYKYSGLGHERGAYGIEDYLETKSIYQPERK